MSDLIDRQAAIEAMFAGMPGLTFDGVLRVLRTMPSSQPERKTGRWTPIPSLLRTLGICSVCHNVSGREYEYCPWCGAKMMGENADG